MIELIQSFQKLFHGLVYDTFLALALAKASFSCFPLAKSRPLYVCAAWSWLKTWRTLLQPLTATRLTSACSQANAPPIPSCSEAGIGSKRGGRGLEGGERERREETCRVLLHLSAPLAASALPCCDSFLASLRVFHLLHQASSQQPNAVLGLPVPCGALAYLVSPMIRTYYLLRRKPALL